MRILSPLACLSMAALLSACGTPDHGYYDAKGNFVPTGPIAPAEQAHDNNYGYDTDYPNHRVYKTTTTTYTYDRPGYYDANGYYVSEDSNMSVPEDMFPPQGMCRVWFPDRVPEYQPRVESCNGIREHVPAGAYVIYGG